MSLSSLVAPHWAAHGALAGSRTQPKRVMALLPLEGKTSTDLGGPCPEVGSQRRGRDLQRYSTAQERLVAGCIPIRCASKDGLDGVEVLMISSSNGKGFVFPKGGWETDETVEAAAARETVEEAGVRGVIEEPLLGAFAFHSSKAERMHSAHQGKCIAYMFVMRVEEELPVWPEQTHRNRVWLPLDEACSKCRHEWMREALLVWAKRRGWEGSSSAACREIGRPPPGAVQQPQKKLAAGI